MSRHVQWELATSNKRLIEQIDELKSYANEERECDQDQ